MNDTVDPASEHTLVALASIVSATARPELAVAVTVYVGPPTAAPAGAVEVNVIVWLAWLTTWLTTLLVLGPKFTSPAYCAVIPCVATAKVPVANVATPLPFSVPDPIFVAPSRKLTVPVGVPDPGGAGVTVAVKVTVCANTDGLMSTARAVWLGAFATVSVNACVASGGMPLAAVSVQEYVLAVPGPGVPASVPVPLPLSTKFTPVGKVHPLNVSAAEGTPIDVIENVPAWPTMNVAAFALVICGACVCRSVTSIRK